MMKSLVLLLSLLSSTFLMAADLDDVYLGQPAVGGTGCPYGTTSAVLSPDKKSLSILFDSYIAEAGAYKSYDRKTCNLAIPVHVPQGYSVSIFKLDYRGYMMIPYGGRGKFKVEYFFAGQSGPTVYRDYPGGFNDDLLIRTQLKANAVVWSNCGADVNLRVNSSLFVQSNRQGEDALGSIDSVDVRTGLKYHLQWRRCRM